MLVIDASALAVALADDGAAGAAARARLRGEALRAPESVDVEVLSVLRGRVLGGKLSARRADSARRDLASMRFPRSAHLPLTERIWELRANVSAYDAAYVALAELLDCPVLTADAELAHASGPRCGFEVLEGSD